MTFDAVTLEQLPSRELTELHLLRHGEVETGGRRCAYGHLDLPLSARGRQESAALFDHAMAHIPRPEGVFSSDLRRCLDLAEPLAEAWGVPLHREPALREQAMGAWEGRAWEDLTREDPAAIHAWWDDYLRAQAPGGESLEQLFDKVGAWVEQANLVGRRWVIVSHIGVIRGFLCRFLNHPPDAALRFAPGRGSHTHLLLAKAGAVLERLGERPAGAARGRHHPPRLALSGSAGVGKTTLGRALAAHYEVPFIEEGMRKRLESGLNLHAIGREGTRQLMLDLWEEQREAEARALSASGGFVADRSSVDFATFWLFYGFADDSEQSLTFLAQTLEHARVYDRVVLLPWGALPLVADGIRSSNRWLQRHFQATVEGMLCRELPAEQLLRLPALTDPEARLRWISSRLG